MSVQPPRPKPPPLNALRAFESAARLGGFSSAARELCVTQAAVAQQIRQLEEWAGIRLFERHARGVRLTASGRAVSPSLNEAFDLIGVVSQKLRRNGAPGEVRIAALPSIAQLWLSPRLPRVRSVSDQASISVTALEMKPNLEREMYDLSIFFMHENEMEPGMIDLGADVIYPVCSPEIAKGLKEYPDLKSQKFLHDSTWKDDWQTWLDHVGLAQAIDPEGPSHSLYALAVEEARNSAGVLIAHHALVVPLVERGELVAPFGDRLQLERRLVLEVADNIRGKVAVEKVISALSEFPAFQPEPA